MFDTFPGIEGIHKIGHESRTYVLKRLCGAMKQLENIFIGRELSEGNVEIERIAYNTL